MVYAIRLAEPQDLNRIFEIYAGARAFMAASGNPDQWGTSWPEQRQTIQDLENGILYVLDGGDVVHGVFAMIPGEDPTYSRIEQGEWHFQEPYCAIHRVAGDGSGGIFGAIAAFALKSCPHLRIDTHAQNQPMRRAVERAGFAYCGIIYTRDGSPRLAYDCRKA